MQDSGYRGRDDSAYLAGPSSGVGGRAASPDPKGVSRARSSSPGVAAAVSGAALPHQSLEHAMQTKLTIGKCHRSGFSRHGSVPTCGESVVRDYGVDSEEANTNWA